MSKTKSSRKRTYKKKSLYGKPRARIEGHASGGTISTFTPHFRPASRFTQNLMKDVSRYTYSTNFGGTLNSVTPGIQTVTDWSSYSAGRLASFYNGGAMQTMCDLINQNLPTTLNPKNLIMKIFLEEMQCTQLYRNNTNNDIVIDIYDIVARRDQPSGTDNSSPAYPPVSAWSLGTLDSGGNVFDYQTAGSKPFQSPLFTTLYKVERITNVCIPTGAFHEHKITHRPNKMWEAGPLQASQLWVYNGLTRFTMVIVKGVPVAEKGDGLLAHATLSTTQLSFVSTTNYVFKFMANNTPFVNNNTNLDSRDVVESFISDVTGQLENTTVAV